MKNLILFFLIWSAAIACREKKQDVNPQTGSENTRVVSFRQLTTVPASGTKLKVELLEIADSRCPSNADCVTMGSVQLKFMISKSKSKIEVKVNFSGDRKNNSQTFVLDGQTYELEVSEVLPYPGTLPTPYKVSLSIEKK